MSLLAFDLTPAWLLVGVLVALGGWIGCQLVRQDGRIRSRLAAPAQRPPERRLTPTLAASGGLPDPPAASGGPERALPDQVDSQSPGRGNGLGRDSPGL